jgi:hypothetical protein
MEQTLPVINLPPQTDTFTWAYIDCALWSSMDDAGTPLGDNHDATDLAAETLERMKADCALFKVQYWESICGDLSRAGHDFWLTRNGHGAGFWDGDWPEDVGENLTEACRLWGEVDLYLGDDGKIYAS